MAISQRRINNARWVLESFPVGELQSKSSVETPTKFGRKYDSPIAERTEFVKGTGIPASTLHKFQTGEWTPRDRSLRKLADFYSRYQEKILRAEGANTEDARRLSKQSVETVRSALYNYRKWSGQISRTKAVRRVDIQWGMAHSDIYYDDWEAHIRESYGKKPR